MPSEPIKITPEVPARQRSAAWRRPEAGDRSAASLAPVRVDPGCPIVWLPRPTRPAGLSLVLLPGRARPPGSGPRAPPGSQHRLPQRCPSGAPAAEDLHSVGLLACGTLPRASRVGTEATDRAVLGAALQVCQLHLAPCSRPPREWRPRRRTRRRRPRSAWRPSPSSARRRAARVKTPPRDELEREN